MRILASVNQIKQRIRFDNDAEDEDFLNIALSASSMILNYLKNPFLYQDSNGDVLLDSNGDVVIQTTPYGVGVPPEVFHSTVILAGMMKRDPDGQEMDKWQQGYLPWQVTAGIYMLRDPGMA
jgi:hypothetical protein